MRSLLAVADSVEAMLRRFAGWTSWLMIVLMVVICFDVITRKMGFQLPGMGSTRLQELEWHLHTVLFSMWLGYCYILNAHPRVDTITAHRSAADAGMDRAHRCVSPLPYAAWSPVRPRFRRHVGATGELGRDRLPQRWVSSFCSFRGGFSGPIVSVPPRLIVSLFCVPPGRARMNIERVDPSDAPPLSAKTLR